MPPSFFFFLKKKSKNQKPKKKEEKNMLGWLNHPIEGGWQPHLAWGGSATPRPAAPWTKLPKKKHGGFDDDDGGDGEMLTTTEIVARAQSSMLARARCSKALGGRLRGEIFSMFEASQIHGITSLQPVAAPPDLQTRCLCRPLDPRSLDCRTAETFKSLIPPAPHIAEPPKPQTV